MLYTFRKTPGRYTLRDAIRNGWKEWVSSLLISALTGILVYVLLSGRI